MSRLFEVDIEGNRDSIALGSRAVNGMRNMTLEHHQAARYRVERNLVDVEDRLLNRQEFIELQRATGIDKSESSGSRIRLYKVRTTEH